METLKFNVFNFLNKSKKTTVPLVFLWPTFPYLCCTMQIPMLVSLLSHSATLKESYSTVEMVLQKLCFNEHKWLICVDLKMVNLLLGQQGGYVKCPCFLLSVG